MSDQMYSHDELLSLAQMLKQMRGEATDNSKAGKIASDEKEFLAAVDFLKKNDIDVEKEFGLVRDVISQTSTGPATGASQVELSPIAKTGFTNTLQILLPGGSVGRTLYMRGSDTDCVAWAKTQLANLPGFGWTIISGKGTLLARKDPADLEVKD